MWAYGLIRACETIVPYSTGQGHCHPCSQSGVPGTESRGGNVPRSPHFTLPSTPTWEPPPTPTLNTAPPALEIGPQGTFFRRIWNLLMGNFRPRACGAWGEASAGCSSLPACSSLVPPSGLSLGPLLQEALLMPLAHTGLFLS